MNEHQITCFLQVVESGSISKAAGRLHMTQPAVTHQIGSLEKELEVSLFRRTSTGVWLTAAGNSFLPAAQNLNEAFRKAHASVKKIFNEDTPFVLGVPRAMMLDTEIYQNLMLHLTEELPDIAISVKELVGGSDIYDDLKNGVDCVITMDLGSSMKYRDRMRALPLFRNYCYIVMGKKNPLFPEKIVTAEELQPFDLYYAEYERHYIETVKKHLSKADQLRFRETSTPLTATHALISGRACFVMPIASTEYFSEHVAVLHTEQQLPITCAFYLKEHKDSVYETVAKIIQRIHLKSDSKRIQE